MLTLSNTLELPFKMPLNAEMILHQYQHHHHYHHHHHVNHLLQHHHHHLNQHLHNQSNLIQSLDNHDLHPHQRSYILNPRKTTHVISPLQKERRTLMNRSASSRQRTQIQFFLFAALAYVLSPIDLIPELIFGVFGLLDDILFLCMCLFCIAITLVLPLIGEMQRTILYKLGLKQEPLTANKKF